MKIKKNAIFISFVMILICIFTYMTIKHQYDKELFRKYALKYVLEEVNSLIENRAYYEVTSSDISLNELKVTNIISVFRYHLLRIDYWIPSEGDKLILVFFYNDKNHVLHLLSKQVNKSRYIEKNTAPKFETYTIPDGKRPPGY